MKMFPVGDSSIKVIFSKNIDQGLNLKIQSFCHTLQQENIRGIIEWVPSYDAVTIYYNPVEITLNNIMKNIYLVFEKTEEKKKTNTFVFNIPVCYGGKFGPDLERVANFNQISLDEVIERHIKREYLVYMLGFLPGFPYLGGLDPKIATPRLETPRRETFQGSVGIAHEQTGIYPLDSPGGWNIIGRTPIKLFNPQDESPFLLQAGDYIRFYSINEKEYKELDRLIALGEFHIKREVMTYD